MGIPRTSLFAKKPTARSAGSAKANRAGDALEELVMRSVGDCQGRILELEPLPKAGARFTGFAQAHHLPICCDFVGTVIGPGTAVFFDAKSSDNTYGFDLANQKVLKPHQATCLYRQAAANAIAGLLVANRKGGQYLWLDGKHLGPGREYIAWHDARWIRLGSTGGLIQFRDLVRAYARVESV